jgi:YgiT-type zinc finger domain-containing protein
MLDIDTCPSCGSKRVRKVRRTITRVFKGRSYTVPNLEFHECPDCGEKMYDREAMRKIEACSPAFARAHSSK